MMADKIIEATELLVSIFGAEYVSMLQHSFSDYFEQEAIAKAIAVVRIKQLIKDVEKVEETIAELRLEGISQKAMSKTNVVQTITKKSVRYYDEKLLPLYKHQEYLFSQKTEAPLSVDHANRIIVNMLSGEKRSSSMSQSTQTKAVLLKRIEFLEEENQTLREEFETRMAAKDKIILDLLAVVDSLKQRVSQLEAAQNTMEIEYTF